MLFLYSLAQASPVKELKLKPSDVGMINTSVGYSTVLQLSQKPLNVVLGDQSAFRVEFINDSITLKPLRAGSKSNIFIFTENDRFNLTLKSGPASNVDYVVRLRRIYSDPQKSVPLNQFRTDRGLRFTLIRVTERDSDLFLDFSIENQRKKSIYLRPEQFRIVSENMVRPIRSLYLDSQTIKAGSVLSGSMLFPGKKLNQLSIWLNPTDEKPIAFNFNKKSPSKMEVLRAF
jgi:hypothetical protein